MAADGRRWQFDLRSTPPGGIPKPPGFTMGASASRELETRSSAAQLAMKNQRAMQVARMPGQSLFMNGFMMYMAGSSINIFSIMITGMVLSSAATGLMNVNKAFASLDDGKVKLMTPKAIYFALNVAGLALALYKLTSLGLLPVTSADWTSRLPLKALAEHSGAPLAL
ncbi:hypothetical protein JKP88DRAFT_236494 [Tribonema minus]|uniref:ER membrane protein complex subunit 4 n=1 Tax=Tribonema minus TaxID=303371 RepID=A0A835Z218_9STRA|nr:hypothetical protein JKP88DRAFT_236494 [Tribonema minus]